MWACFVIPISYTLNDVIYFRVCDALFFMYRAHYTLCEGVVYARKFCCMRMHRSMQGVAYE